MNVTVNGCEIERISEDERTSFYPIKRWAVHFPDNRTDPHGAKVGFYATKKEAVDAAKR